MLVAFAHAMAAARWPVVFLPDSMDYAVSGARFLAAGNFDHMGTWRVPGFPLVFAFFLWFMRNPVLGIGLLNAACVVASALLAGVITGRRIGPWGGAVVMLLVGLDPVGFLYQRAAMPESLSTLMVVGIGAAVIAIGNGRTASRSAIRAVVIGLMLGTLVGLGCYLRPNLQVLLPWVVLATGLVMWRMPSRAIAIMMGVVLGCGAVLAPWVMRTHQRTDRVSLVVGAGITRAISVVEVGVLDLDQPGTLSEPVRASILARQHAGTLGPYDLIDALTPMLSEANPDRRRAELDALCASLARESARRHPGRHTWHITRSFVNVSGLWPIRDTGYRENAWWARAWVEPMTRDGNHHVLAGEYRELPEAEVRAIVRRTHAPMPRFSDVAAVLVRGWWITWEWGRVGLAWLSLVGAVVCIRRGQVGLAMVMLVPLAHAAVLAGLTWAGIDRYGVPFWPLTMMGGVIGACALVRGARGRGM